ncbi:MAG: HU family DNA-binding protein [Paludibacteraceae bacterium]|nr:HU family DNA-binding protein [Paludibacteraceae bacterium]
MLTKDLINRIAGATGLPKKQVEHLLATHNAIIRETLMDGKAVQLPGLGTLEIKERKERAIVHPRTGERTVIPAKNQLAFRPVVNLKNELNKQ